MRELNASAAKGLAGSTLHLRQKTTKVFACVFLLTAINEGDKKMNGVQRRF